MSKPVFKTEVLSCGRLFVSVYVEGKIVASTRLSSRSTEELSIQRLKELLEKIMPEGKSSV